ncbi:hypothetical protein P9D34_12535 [Bacillus swezeyi]|uniref:Uncharacterized protein n=1 Tax=Bacillus swezeyi TaxID=1925020 RepID=A0A1R1RMW0_9BACI|nr:hypothetical protein [Bacillus swezeyi]MEC1261272.1 hypothetical protein [Bacillus swezeyi]MED2929257.1 hypothetical protein [Bacillus swezeyi]MED2963716.1 hypothetical protein [Bacillus swezeyi]MED3073578.1 hypothetical protein [Bacillus swezeyi]MED3081838.1 hypothetical protein [Bacillus swezeyi]
MNWTQILTVVITALLSAFFTNLGAYAKDKKLRNENATSKYTEDALMKIYSPLYKIVTSKRYTPKGYDGLTHEQMIKIKGIIESFPELCPPDLEDLVGDLYDDSIRLYQMNKMGYGSEPKVDEDRRLLNYITNSFNKTRKELGIISDK